MKYEGTLGIFFESEKDGTHHSHFQLLHLPCASMLQHVSLAEIGDMQRLSL